ncbi:hypothetical protein [Thalassoroseus pseudoceratinae]|uniref:hypothetical protein n=1 Tax=Thalassoroseus pseudoceratinae TaxID=2713176 RepID=UPI00141FA32F|nr:hypothetical protein [Thalassoroseus pseudoceratinae]
MPIALLILIMSPQLALAGLHTAPVPAVDELEILDPRVDPEGKPRAIVVPSPDGGQRVEIPPTIIVHKLYYTGNRCFQAPLLPGGPTILVVNHPRTNEQYYVDVQLLPGAPKVYYFHDCIAYDYGHQVTIIKFGLCGEPHVVVMSGQKWRSRLNNAATHVAKSSKEWVKRTGVPNVVEHVGRGMHDACMTTADRVHDIGERIVGPVGAALERLPLTSFFKGTPESQAEHLRAIEALTPNPANFGVGETIPTIR